MEWSRIRTGGDGSANVTISIADLRLGLGGAGSVKVRDVWAKADLPSTFVSAAGTFTIICCPAPTGAMTCIGPVGVST